jgi:hypothetical protein
MSVLLLIAVSIAPSGLATTVVGRIYTEDGNPVKAASFTVQSTAAAPTSKGFVSSSQYKYSTDNQGKFVLDLPDGSYSVCVRTDNRGLLDSCQWFLSDSIIQVRPGLPPFKMTLRAGLLMRIRLNDPQSLWSQNSSGSLQSAVSVRFTVYDSLGYSHPVAQVSGDDKGRNFEILVRPDQDYQLSVQSQGLDVVDEAQALASHAPAAAIHSAKSDLARTRVFTIVPSGSVGNGNGNGKAKGN